MYPPLSDTWEIHSNFSNSLLVYALYSSLHLSLLTFCTLVDHSEAISLFWTTRGFYPWFERFSTLKILVPLFVLWWFIITALWLLLLINSCKLGEIISVTFSDILFVVVFPSIPYNDGSNNRFSRTPKQEDHTCLECHTSKLWCPWHHPMHERSPLSSSTGWDS